MVVYWSCALEYSISEPLANCSAPERNLREVGPLRGRSRTDRQSLSSNCPSIVLLDRCGIYWVLDARPKMNSVPRPGKKLFLSQPEDREVRIRLSSYRHIARKSHIRRGEWNSLISVSNTIFRGFHVGKDREMRWAKWAKR
jgi:hypothetical protein